MLLYHQAFRITSKLISDIAENSCKEKAGVGSIHYFGSEIWPAGFSSCF